MCYAEIAELLQKGVYGGALRWIEVCAKYEVEGRKTLLNSLLSICIKKASIKSAECFETILTYVADGNSSVYAESAKTFADAAIKTNEFDAAKLYYGKVLSVKPDSIAAAQGKFFADIRCANERELPSALVNLTDWSCFEEVLVVQTDDADDLKWIEKLASACMENIRMAGVAADKAIFTVFEKLLSYIPEVSDSVLLRLLRQAAELCLKEGLFEQSQKYYEMFISENAEDSTIYWGLLQAKLKCRSEEELIRQSQPIGQFAEFENAQVCAADEKKVLEHYIDIRDQQSKHIKAAKKRKRLLKIGSIVLAAVIVVVAALVGWFTYYNSQNQLLYHVGENGYTVSAGKFYETESRLVIPAEWNGQPVVAIESEAFAGHEEIEELVLPASIEVIRANAFAGCANLKSVVIAADNSARAVGPQTSLREIGDGAFSGCTNLEMFNLPYGVERIGARAFAGTGLSEATIPNTVDYIGTAVFDGCDRLQTIIVGDREAIPTEWAENWKDGCNATVEFRLRVIFDYNGATAGNTVGEQYVLFGGEFEFPVPERKGYTFDGWFRGDARLTDSHGNSIAEWQFENGGTATAKWAPNINRVVFNANGGSGNMSEQEIATNESANLSVNAFTRKGYTFAGWAESATGSVVYEDGAEYTMGAESSYELFAVWTANRNEIIFDGNGATDGSMEIQFIETDSSIALTKNAFLKTGYKFVGWATSADGEVIYADGANYIMGAEAQYTLYAVWQTVDYTIRYSLNNGIAGDNPSSYTIESEDIILKAPTRAGYRFAGWLGTELSAPSLSVMIKKGSTGNREYTATWEANTNKIVFNANGGHGEMPMQSIKTDETAPLSSNLFTREGYTFVGWAETQNGKAKYTDGANYTMGTESEYALYAVWETVKYTISYILNGGSVSGNPNNYTIESDTFRLENPVRAGYTFAGWTGTGLEEPILSVSVAQGSTGNREYTANWSANTNKIIFHANGGSGNMPAQGMAADESAALSLNTFVHAGYTFIGWATSESGPVVYEDGDLYKMGIAAEYHLYAVWSPNLNKVHFDGNGADEGTMNPLTAYTDSKVTLTLNAYQRKGYQFVGWATEKDGNVVYENGEQIIIGADPSVTLFAKWQALSYKVILIFEDTNIAEDEVTFDSVYSLAVPERRGYQFGGWYSAPGGGGTKYADEEGNGIGVWSYDGDITLYAYWLGSDGLAYTLNENGTYTLTGLTDTDLTEVYLPEYFEGKPVTEIAENAFASGSNITEMLVPASISAIGKGAFAGCTALQSLTVPFIGNTRGAEGEAALLGWLFSDTQMSGCTLVYQYYSEYGMSAAYIPDSLEKVNVTDAETIGYGAFSSITSLQRVSITANILGERAFYDCASLAEVELCEGITAIGQSAFARCVSLQKAVIPNSVRSIGRYVFDECAALTSLTLPFIGANAQASGAEGALGYLFGNVTSADMVSVNQSSVTAYFPARLANLTITNATQIPANALRGLTMLINISWDDKITAIGDYALYGCTGVTALTLPVALQTVGNYAFYNIKISVLELPQSVVSLGTYALYGSGLRTLWVSSSSVVSIGNNALNNTHTALKIYVTDSLLNSYKSSWSAYSSRIYSFNCIRENGMAIDGTVFLQYFGEETVLALPSNITEIGAYAFAGTNVRSVLVPGNVRTIGSYAFSGCDTLESVRLLSGVRTISANAFNGAVGLIEVEIPNTVTEIGALAFYNCASLTEIVIPDSVTSIGHSAFRGCNSLVKMTLPFVGESREVLASVENSNSSTAGSRYLFGYIFGSTTNSSTSGVEGAVYQGQSRNGSYYRLYYIPDSLREIVITDATGISANAFYGCTMLTSITLNEGITIIYDRAFYNCDGLTEMVIPESVASIGTYWFYGCGNLAKVTLPSGLTEISDCMFLNCTALTSVNGNGEVIIGANVTSIGAAAFSGCTLISKVTLPNGLAEIGASAFSGAISLTQINSEAEGKVILREGITSIGNYAFRNLGKITEVVVPNSVTSIGQGAFQGCNSLVKMTLPFVGKDRAIVNVNSWEEYRFGYIFGHTTHNNGTTNNPNEVYHPCLRHSSFWACVFLCFY